MIEIYLYANAVLYTIFAGWMTLSPWRTANAVGYESLSPSGRSEYLVIYGGLQFGLAAIFALTAVIEHYQPFGVVIAVCLYVPIVLYRSVTVLKFWPVKSTTLGVAALEFLLLVCALILFLEGPR